ncbi:MAG: FAD-dependent oxidoreductase [Alphaproteobacteria bacterium]
MFVDGRTFNNETLQADICIIGGGVAGIALAREFASTNLQVILLESGGIEGDADTQMLYKGHASGRNYNLMSTRLRLLGGSSNHWKGLCAPLDARDFEARDGIAFSGWPISKDELLPYYRKAADYLNLSNTRNADFKLPDDLMPVHPDLQPCMWRQAHALYPAETYHALLKDSQNIRVILHSNVMRIDADDNNAHVQQIIVRTLAGNSFAVQATRYVLCCGGIENARLLLLSRGLGNTRDQVGRYFMEHLRCTTGKLYTFNSNATMKQFQRYTGMPGKYDKLYGIIPSDHLLKEERMLNSAMVIQRIRRIKDPPDAVPYMAHMMGVAPHSIYEGHLFGRVEQAPDPANRVTLSDDMDALGQPRTALHVTAGKKEWQSLRRLSITIAQHMSASKTGVVKLLPWIYEHGDWPKSNLWSNHHMGTTRMGDDPKTSVVDKNCKIHGVDNVYVAGSSVFATSGWANPTYTLTALAIRLAEHLKSV